ncbi:hypothetical protein RI054_39g144950 [Pseudoscourfieldia marina]
MSSWRDTLFVWRGELVVLGALLEEGEEDVGSSSEKGASYKWRGYWVGVDAANAAACSMPRPYRFGASEADGEFVAALAGAPIPCVEPILASSSKYTLDGDQWHDDDSHEIVVSQHSDVDGARLVAASGYNEFGHFVSVGSLEGGVLCLARRYLEKRDERCVMRAQQVLNVAAASGAVGGEAPWRTAAKMMGAALQPRKRARGGASEQPATAGSGGNEVKGRGRPPKSADGRRQRERGEGGTYK